jgi:HAD superfamily hydrolase (TIGR01484 family)
MASNSRRVLLCTDLDRTVLPNGPWEESTQARPRLRRLAARPEMALAYVSGRHKALIREAIESYGIPVPHYAIGDVGTTIYEVRDDRWVEWEDWWDAIAPDWKGMRHDKLAGVFQDLNDLRLQEPEKQNRFKLSYYARADIDRSTLLTEMERRLQAARLQANLIWSVDELSGEGLLDVLPASANKLHAIRFLMAQHGFSEARTVFAGDSGNDLPALTSGLQAVLVANASEEVRQEALRENDALDTPGRLYLARGSFLGMNGNYSAGVLEGLAYFLPETRAWMTQGEEGA